MRFFKSKKFYLFLSLLTLVLLIGKGVYEFISFPNELHIIVGKEQSFDFDVPAVATISKSDKAIVNINKKQLQNSVSVELDKPLYVWSDSECTMDMKLSFLGVEFKNVKVSVIPHLKLIPLGKSVGVTLETDGIMVLGFGEVNQSLEDSPCSEHLMVGDMLITANGVFLDSKEKLIEVVENSTGAISFQGNRDGTAFSCEITPTIDKETGKRRLGAWVRDSTQGIGTLTYIDKNTNKFAGLGHGIVDVDTKQIMKARSGQIMQASIKNITKGEKGEPGELLGSIYKDNVLGNISSNNQFGIFGECDISKFEKFNELKEMPIALQNEIQEGDAYIFSNIEGDKIEKFNIYIESVNRYNTDNSKGMVIKITDKRLLQKTNGIVQGMSGSPIIQNGKLIGAVTHVFVREPDRGYGIFIENMINVEK